MKSVRNARQAKVAKVISYTGNPDDFEINPGNRGASLDRSEKAMQRLLKESHKALAEGKSVGLIYQHPCGNGYAYYRVAKEKPFTVEHIPYLDAYRLPDPHERGLDIKDVRGNCRKRNAMKLLFSKPSSED